jgi:ParB family chromosome partitioning protein
MAELRSVDPRILQPNPDNPRHTPVSPAMDEQLLASIKAIGIIQPPIVVEKDGALVINAGNRRVKQAIKADFATIDVLVCDADEARDLMRSLAENLIRASMNSVDIWRGIDTLEKKGWNEQAIADALALPLRTVKRLKLLAHLHSPMLDAIAAGSAPSEDQLRTIAAASRDEQAQVWKKHKPKKGYEASWYEIARALAKRRIPFSAAKFGDDLAQAYGVVWEDDLFAPADEDGRYTTNVDGFFGAQQEWLQNNLPERGTLLPQDEYGRPQLPKKAENVYGTPGKNDRIGHYLDPYSGAVKTLVYRLRDSRKAKTGNEPAGTAPDPGAPQPKTRPDVTQKGLAMIGDFRTDALHQALRESRIEDTTLLGLLVLALAGKNVSIQSGADMSPFDRERIAATITEGGVLTSDFGLIRTAARSMLVAALSCRDNMSNSGPGARIAGEAIGASLYLPTMATDEFLSCLSRQALEKAATTEGVRPEVRVRDARGRFIERFTDTRYVYPGALFQVTPEEIAAAATPSPSHLVRWPSEVRNDGFDGDTPTGEDIVSDTDALAASANADTPPVD